MKTLFISETTIKANSIIETNVDSKIIANTIFEVQDLELKPLLGADLFAAIANEVLSASTISGYTITPVNLELLEDYIKPFLIYGTLSYGFVPLHYKLTNKGVNRKNDENATTANFNELQQVKDNYDNKFATYKQRLIKHLEVDLNENLDVVSDSSGESTGWYLPDNTFNLSEFFEGLANKTGFYSGYYRRYN
ncbi:hypothetical protein [Mucilaginibacter sp.]|uniref:DUF6712 family protein n=1 Tax=Mucilaginibacter sp. TaxID=1882438 RepID=UPI003D1053DD